MKLRGIKQTNAAKYKAHSSVAGQVEKENSSDLAMVVADHRLRHLLSLRGHGGILHHRAQHRVRRSDHSAMARVDSRQFPLVSSALPTDQSHLCHGVHRLSQTPIHTRRRQRHGNAPA